VYENKGTAGAVEASSNQTAFYAVLLAISTGQVWQAYIHVLSSKRKREVVLDAARLSKLWEASLRLEQLSQQADVPKVAKIPLCASCSLAIFCGYD
jgi:CRISPR-associated exonuclease Cas4